LNYKNSGWLQYVLILVEREASTSRTMNIPAKFQIAKPLSRLNSKWGKSLPSTFPPFWTKRWSFYSQTRILSIVCIGKFPVSILVLSFCRGNIFFSIFNYSIVIKVGVTGNFHFSVISRYRAVFLIRNTNFTVTCMRKVYQESSTFVSCNLGEGNNFSLQSIVVSLPSILLVG